MSSIAKTAAFRMETLRFRRESFLDCLLGDEQRGILCYLENKTRLIPASFHHHIQSTVFLMIVRLHGRILFCIKRKLN